LLKNAWLIPLLPAISSVLILAVGKRLPGKGHEIGIGALGLGFLGSLVCAAEWIGKATEGGHREAVTAHATWIKLAGVDIGAGIHIDGLAVMMLVVVTFISLLVHI
jgi:NADH-quinone oxidoreductase subunit L